MSCSFFTRLMSLRHRRRVPDTFVAPALPSADNKTQIPLQQLVNIRSEIDRFYLDCLAYPERGCTLIVPDIPPHLTPAVLLDKLQRLPGYVTFELDQTLDHTVSYQLDIQFATASEAAQAIATFPIMDIGDGQRRRLAYADSNGQDHDTQPARKRPKLEESPAIPLPECRICSEKIEDDKTYSRPCYYCQAVWCYDCLRNQFSASLSDQERFPARCCGRVLHFDVAKDVISAEDYSKYRTRFEQSNTSKPLYCANKHCSIFLPSRVAKPDDKRQLKCPECGTTTCEQCRSTVDTTLDVHECVEADEIAALLSQCSHIRCPCGAHFCWDCQRPIQICWSKPCERAREEGDETDDYDIPQEESDTDSEAVTAIDGHNVSLGETVTTENNNSAAVNVVMEPATPATDQTEAQGSIFGVAEDASLPTLPFPQDTQTNSLPTTQPLEPPESLVNLDGENFDEWETRSLDFGDEPIDESWDAWGCMHQFSAVHNKTIFLEKGRWLPNIEPPLPAQVLEGLPSAASTLDNHEKDTNLPNSTKQIDCMKCYSTIVLAEPHAHQAIEKIDAEVATTPDILPAEGSEPKLECRSESVSKAKSKRKAKRLSDPPKLANCRKCGVFYCTNCKKAAIKEIHMTLNKQIQQ
ncbi:hypothetical protein LTR05_003274 [Lithohypha guttulata]|uniref:RING-type domain-containing protein n=1 Tax=Lithohypha guttulata TaxID=1690604 RepID=A0AAN7Y8X7_9EURO|nr:hypothetical protein LTR05_003274 [Lithohypha guttulata]